MLCTSPWFKLVVYHSPEESLASNRDLYASRELYCAPDSFNTAPPSLIVADLIIFSHQLQSLPPLFGHKKREMDLICMSKGSYIYSINEEPTINNC